MDAQTGPFDGWIHDHLQKIWKMYMLCVWLQANEPIASQLFPIILHLVHFHLWSVSFCPAYNWCLSPLYSHCCSRESGGRDSHLTGGGMFVLLSSQSWGRARQGPGQRCSWETRVWLLQFKPSPGWRWGAELYDLWKASQELICDFIWNKGNPLFCVIRLYMKQQVITLKAEPPMDRCYS